MSERSGITVEVKGPNTWAVQGGQGDDELTTYTLLDGPGIPGLITPLVTVMATASVPLAEIRKTRFAHRITRAGLTPRKECWEAVTTDGLWVFEREESPGTPWIVRHQPTGELVDMRSTLRDCRWYVAAGHAQDRLERQQAHDRGEHAAGRDPRCGRC